MSQGKSPGFGVENVREVAPHARRSACVLSWANWAGMAMAFGATRGRARMADRSPIRRAVGRYAGSSESIASAVQAARSVVDSDGHAPPGGVSEWFKEPVLKTGVRLSRTVGSNPTPTAFTQPRPATTVAASSAGGPGRGVGQAARRPHVAATAGPTRMNPFMTAQIRLFVMIAAFAPAARGGEAELVLFVPGRPAAALVVSRQASDAELDAAGELARLLGEALDTEFAVAREDAGSTGIFVGETDLAEGWGLPGAEVGEEGYAIRVRPDVGRAVIVGGTDMATKFAVYDFLARFVGVRWFLPGELFQIVPRHESLAVAECDLTETPAFVTRTFGYSLSGFLYAGEHDPQIGLEKGASRWALRNRLSSDGRGHMMYCADGFRLMFPPGEYFKDHPEYYPLLNGKRSVPNGSTDWQLCTTNPDVISIVIEKGRQFFRQNPDQWKWFNLGVNDGGGWCGCPPCVALDVPRPHHHGAPVSSDRYYHFVAEVAKALLKEFPDRKVGVLAYERVELPPLGIRKLPPNVCVLITHDSFQYHDRKYLTKDLKLDRRWARIANKQLYRWDYVSLGWRVPRFFPQRMADDLRRMKRTGLLRGFYTTDRPVWPANGPMLYVAAQLLWDPDKDPDTLLNEFYTMCYGPAAEPMKNFWELQEQIWERPRPGKWFEGHVGGIGAQIEPYTAEHLDYFDRQFADALRLAGDDPLIAARIRFFHRGWQYVEHYVREKHFLAALHEADSPARICQAAARLVTAVEQRHEFWEEFAQEKTFRNQEKPREGYRFIPPTEGWEQRIPAALVLAAGRVAAEAPGALDELMRLVRDSNLWPELADTLALARGLATSERPANLLRNSEFAIGDANRDPSGSDWVSAGAPSGWATWTHTRGKIKFKNGVASVRGADVSAIIQTLPVAPGEKVVGTVRYRMPRGSGGLARLLVSWKNQDGAWHSAPTVGFDADACLPAAKWRQVLVCKVVPPGAALAVFRFGGRDQNPDDVVEFKAPYFAKVTTAPDAGHPGASESPGASP